MLNSRQFIDLFRKQGRKLFATRQLSNFKPKQFSLNSEFFENYTPDEETINEIEESTKIRKSHGSVQLLRHHYKNFMNESESEKRKDLRSKLITELKKFPNKTHPTVLSYGADSDKVELYSFGDLHNNPMPDFKSYEELGKMSTTIRTSNLGNFTGPGSYYFMDSVAKLARALVDYTMDNLYKEGFQLITVPDILPAELIEACGMTVDDHATQVYRLKPSDLCLSGTSEMALAGFFSGKTMKAEDAPKKVMATSRCFRAEASAASVDGSLYRVHCFTKVEMFSACLPTQSDGLLEEFRDIQRRLFEGLGLCFKLYDMPVYDLGLPAYRKYDIEAWMPSRKSFGEISSTSNCTDYQSKRLNIYFEDGGKKFHAHTVNGTACAIPRMIIAILEQYQTSRSIRVPEVLQPYMGETELRSSTKVPPTRIAKHKEKKEKKKGKEKQ
ncbi:serine--tRNA ligase, mitochondrial [Contarinia nasturtii]|uniref:serine--tRNA ligase, mitochondrial n=1 Tax=Contarinia nasturtii TaxID=265458 RepID=UPI0012D4648B|nr:serine--tRNA ligase, mitochondrial [Contarinia nasturtii]